MKTFRQMFTREKLLHIHFECQFMKLDPFWRINNDWPEHCTDAVSTGARQWGYPP